MRMDGEREKSERVFVARGEEKGSGWRARKRDLALVALRASPPLTSAAILMDGASTPRAFIAASMESTSVTADLADAAAWAGETGASVWKKMRAREGEIFVSLSSSRRGVGPSKLRPLHVRSRSKPKYLAFGGCRRGRGAHRSVRPHTHSLAVVTLLARRLSFLMLLP
jgi:hypothetical protein